MPSIPTSAASFATTRMRALCSALSPVREQLQSKKLDVKALNDIAKLGLDPTRGAVVALYPSKALVAVLNATNVGQLITTISAYQGVEPKDSKVTARGVHDIGGFFVANPEGRLVVISNHETTLRAALSNVARVEQVPVRER